MRIFNEIDFYNLRGDIFGGSPTLISEPTGPMTVIFTVIMDCMLREVCINCRLRRYISIYCSKNSHLSMQFIQSFSAWKSFLY